MALIKTERGITHAYFVDGLAVFSGVDISGDLKLPPEEPVETRLDGLDPQALEVLRRAGEISLHAA